MITEPAARADGRCIVCSKVITTDTQYGGDADAFCTSRCCRSYFDCELAIDIDGSALSKARKDQAA